MKKKLLFLICWVNLLTINPTFGQATISVVCPDQWYTYDRTYCLDGTTRKEWHSSTGAKNLITGINNIQVKWHESVTANQYLYYTIYTTDCIHREAIETAYKIESKSILDESGISIKIYDEDNTEPTSLSYCEGKKYKLKLTKKIVDNVSSLYICSYDWYYNNGEGDISIGLYKNNLETDSIDLSGFNLNPEYPITFKVEMWTVCTSNKRSVSSSRKLKYCFEDYGIDGNVTNPTCYDSTNSEISVISIKDPESCVTYANSTDPDRNKIIFTVSKFVDAVYDGDGNTVDDYSCDLAIGANAGASKAIWVDNWGGYFCPAGYVTNKSFEHSSSIILTQNNLILEDTTGNPPYQTYAGIGPGYYEIQVENPLFSPYKLYSETIAPDTIFFSGAQGNAYTYTGSPIYNIPVIGGADTVNLAIRGGTKGYNFELYDSGLNSLGIYALDLGTAFTQNLKTYYKAPDIGEGTYSFRVFDAHNCPSSTLGVTLSEPEPIDTLFFENQAVSCNSSNQYPVGKNVDGQFQLNVKNGIGPYTLRINDVGHDVTSELSANPYRLTSDLLAPGDYEIIIIDNYGNTDTVYSTIATPAPISISFVDTIPAICSPINDGGLIINAAGGTLPYSNHELLNNSEVKIGEADNDTIKGMYGNTSYLIKVEDDNNCYQLKDYFSVPYSNPLYFDVVSSTPPACVGGNTGNIRLKGQGGHDAVYDNFDFDVSAFPPGTETAYYSGDYTFEISKLDTSVYFVGLTDSKGCLYSNSIKLSPNPDYVRLSMIDSAEIRCKDYNDGWVEVEGLLGDTLPGQAYTFYLDGLVYGTGKSMLFENLTPDTHILAISDTNDCLNPAVTADQSYYNYSIYVDEPDTMKVSTSISGVRIKGTNTGKLEFVITGANGEYVYKLLNNQTRDTLKSGITHNTIVLDSLYANDYELLVKDNIHSCTNGTSEWYSVSQITITEPEKYLDLLLIGSDSVSCNGLQDGWIILEGDGGCQGSYSYGKTRSNISSNRGEFGGLAAGVYTFYVKDVCGIVDSLEVRIHEPEALFAHVNSIQNVTCFGGSDGSIGLNVSGGTSPYFYSLNAGLSQSPGTDIRSLPADPYDILVLDAKECSVVVKDTVDQPPALQIDSVSITGALCGESNGSMRAYVRGGTGSYTYEWKDSLGNIVSTDALADTLESGNYSLLLMDAHLCSLTQGYILSNTNGPSIAVQSTVPSSCSGYSDGKVLFTVQNSEGVQPFKLEMYYNYSGTPLLSRSNQAIGIDSLTNLSPGFYQLTLSDSNKCISLVSFVISTPQVIGIVADQVSNPVCNGYSNGFIQVHGVGGNGTYSYVWDNGLTKNMLNNLSSGTYQLTVSDAKGCYSSSSYALSDPEKLTVDLGSDKTLCEGQTYTLSPGVYAYYSWQYNGTAFGNNPQLTVYNQGEYTVLVESAQGCFASDTFNLIVSRDLLEAEFLMPSEVFVNDTVVIIDISWPEPEESYWSFDERVIRVHSEQYIEEIAFPSAGVYDIKLLSSIASCVDSISKQIVVREMPENDPGRLKLGAEEPLIKKFMVYPNPNTGDFVAEVELSEESGVELRIYSMQQNRFILIQRYDHSDTYVLEYGLRQIQTGVYLIILQAGNETKTNRILITR